MYMYIYFDQNYYVAILQRPPQILFVNLLPRAHAQGVKQSVCPSVVVVIVVVGTKIARSRVLGICASCKDNQSVDIGEKLACTHFKLLKKVSLLVLQIVHSLFSMTVVYRPHPSFQYAVVTVHAQAQCWKGSSHLKTAA